MFTRASGIASLISRSISAASIAIALPLSAPHQPRQEAFMSCGKSRQRYRIPPLDCQRVSAGPADDRRGDPRRFGLLEKPRYIRLGQGQEVAPLVLAEGGGMGGQ